MIQVGIQMFMLRSVLPGALCVAMLASGAYASPDEQLVAGSDDFELHGKLFAQKAAELIDSGRCTKADIKDWGGWIRSTTKGDSVYFLYCGGPHVDNRIYLDAKTGRIFR